MSSSTPTPPALGAWLSAVAGIAAAVTDDEPVAAVLERVARTACDLLGYDFCGVFLPSRDGRSLTIAGSHGLSAAYVEQVNAERPILLDVRGPDEAPTSIAFRTASVVGLPDVDLDPAFPWGGVAHEQGYRALVAVPLLRAGAAIGTLNCYRRAPHAFGADELGLLTTLATQVSVALGTAQVRAREQATIRQLERAERIHGQLTAAALRGEGVTGVAETLAGLVGRSVTVLDPTGGVLAGPADGDAVEGPVSRPVVLDGAEVARIVLAADPDEVSPLDLVATEHAATVTALELLRERTAAEVEDRLRGSLLADVLAGGDLTQSRVAERARRTGWDAAASQVVLALRTTGDGGEPRVAALASLARDVLAADDPGHQALVATHRGDVVALRPVGEASSREDLVTLARAVVRRAGRRGLDARAVLSAATDCAGVPSTYRLVRGVLDLAGDGTLEVVDLQETGLDHLLLRLDDPALLRDFVDGVLGPVLRYDAARGTTLVPTLTALLDADLDRAAAARLLHVHVNTVGQRVHRVEELTGLRLGRPRDLLQLASALAVARVSAVVP